MHHSFCSTFYQPQQTEEMCRRKTNFLSQTGICWLETSFSSGMGSIHEGTLFCFVLFCFCFVVMRSTEPGCFSSCSWCLWKALDEGLGVHGLGSMTVWTCGTKVLEYWMIFFTENSIKLNRSWKFERTWNVPLGVLLLERSWWAGFFTGIYLVRLWIQNVEHIDFLSDFLPLKIQINSPKIRFWKEKSVEDMVTLGPTA